jgi:competence protein ComEC
MAGFAVPTVRALVMFALIVALSAVRRYWSGLSVLGATLYIVLLVDPAAPVSAGFWLSFSAVAALLINGLERRPQTAEAFAVTGRWLRQSMIAQAVVAVGLGPLAILFFGQVSLIAPLVNLLAIPVFAFAIVPLVLIGTLLLATGDTAAGAVLVLADALLGSMLAALQFIVSHVGVPWRVPYASPGLLAAGIGCAIAMLWPRPLKGRVLLLAALLPLTVANFERRSAPALQLVVMDVGQGLAVLVRTPGYALLYDAGPAYSMRDAGESVVIPVLRRLGVARLDHVILSHPDADHRGGLNSVLAEFPAPVIASGEFQSGGVLVQPARRCTSGERWVRDDVAFEILGPPPALESAGWAENNLSCVLRVRAGAFTVLLPGDIERAAEVSLVDAGQLSDVDVVIAPHHGSRTSSSSGFISATRPDIVVYSAAHGNRWGFPDPGVVARWQSSGACQISTAASGAITIEIPRIGAPAKLREFRKNASRIWSEPAGGELPCRPQA